MEKEIKRIAPGSVFKVIAASYGLLGMIIGSLAGVFGFIGGAGRLSIGGPLAGLFFGVLYGVLGGVIAAITIVFYNLIAGWLGGIVIELKDTWEEE